MDFQGKGGRLRLDGEMTIQEAAEIRGRVMAALAEHAQLEIDLGGVCEIDTAGIQLLLALKREAAASGKRVQLTGHSAAVIELIELYNLAGTLGDPLVLPAGGGQPGERP